MPIYEYECSHCNGRFQKLVSGFRDPEGLSCPRCRSLDISRAVSRFATVRSEEARLDALSDASMFNGLDENDPQSIARWAKKLGKQLGEDAGEDWDQMVDEMMDEEQSREGEEGEQPPAGAAPRRKKADDLGWA
ncbi:zinc ribbon domain-containing protein [Chloroflexia bacterium SDU3-3]|nr:zinc ribbon domain-containing protein [Chloroflexia bacterium SDU3-3]